jgi:outer membrane immunogenic protein
MVAKAPPAAPYDWTGFYIGGNAGLSVGRNPAVLDATPAFGLADQFYLMPAGAIAGLQAGVNRQISGFVLGAEADIQWSGQQDTRPCLGGCLGAFSAAITQKLPWFGTARVRGGFADGPLLFYYTAGLAFGELRTSVNEVGGGAANAFQFNTTRAGWTVGSGVEAAIGGAWTAKLEYLYVDMGRVTSNYTFAGPGIGAPHIFNYEVRDHVFRAGLNYRFGGASSGVESFPLSRWDGFFVGANIGSGLARNPSGLDAFAGAAQTSADRFHLAPEGYLAGVQAGYDWQRANVVLGVEADIQGTTFDDDRTCVFSCDAAQMARLQQKLPWFGTARARAGYVVGPALLYATGGLAFGSIENRATTQVPGSPAVTTEFTHDRAGWTVGAGIETPLTLLPGWNMAGWTSKSEYLYVDLGSVTDTILNPAGVNFALRSDSRSHVFRTGFTYRFNAATSAAAKN